MIGNAALVGTMLAGGLSILPSLKQFEPAGLLVLIVALALCCLIGAIGFERAINMDTAVAKLTYFAVQLALGFVICWLGFQMSDGRNAVWLVLMPIVSQAAMALRTRWAVPVALAVVAEFEVVVYALTHDVSLIGLLSFAVSVGFVFFFSFITAREQHIRLEMESLAGQLRDANQRLSNYAMQVEELATTRERNRVARDVHDSLGHYLTTVNVQIEAARATLTTDPARAADALGKAQTLTREGLAEVRRSVAALRAGPVELKPLVNAVSGLVDEARASGLAAHLVVTGAPRPLSLQAEMTFFRAAQEGLTNVRKHAHASRAELVLAFADTSVRLTVRDDGLPSANGSSSPDGFGLLGLRERAQLLGGSVSTRIEGGFVLEMILPT